MNEIAQILAVVPIAGPLSFFAVVALFAVVLLRGRRRR
jgi:hypothetical protein